MQLIFSVQPSWLFKLRLDYDTPIKIPCWLRMSQEPKPKIFRWPLHGPQNLPSPHCISVCNSWDIRHSHNPDLRSADPSVWDTMLQTPAWLCPSSAPTQMSSSLCVPSLKVPILSYHPPPCILSLTWEIFYFIIILFFSWREKLRSEICLKGDVFLFVCLFYDNIPRGKVWKLRSTSQQHLESWGQRIKNCRLQSKTLFQKC